VQVRLFYLRVRRAAARGDLARIRILCIKNCQDFCEAKK
jgi:hypothetical protein